MKTTTTIVVPLAAAVVIALGCGANTSSSPSDSATTTTPDDGGASGHVDGAALDSSFADVISTSDAAATTDGGLADPNGDGPYPFAERDATATIATTTDSVAIHVA